MQHEVKIFWTDTQYNFVLSDSKNSSSWNDLCSECIRMFGPPDPNGNFDWEVEPDSITFRFKEEKDAMLFKLKFL